MAEGHPACFTHSISCSEDQWDELEEPSPPHSSPPCFSSAGLSVLFLLGNKWSWDGSGMNIPSRDVKAPSGKINCRSPARSLIAGGGGGFEGGHMASPQQGGLWRATPPPSINPVIILLPIVVSMQISCTFHRLLCTPVGGGG